MKFLTVRKRKSKDKAGRGKTMVEFSFRTKRHKYGDVIATDYISRRERIILICGAHASGKSRYLQKIVAHAEGFWMEQQRPYSPKTKTIHMNNPERSLADVPLRESTWKAPEAVFLGGINPLSSWTDNPAIADWWGNEGFEVCGNDTPWARLPAYMKQDALAVYLEKTKAVLFIDDLDKCTGKKKEVAKSCIRAAFRCVLAMKDENRIDPTIRTEVLRTDPQIIRLETDAAYDATSVLLWALMIFTVVAGFPELAMVLFGLKMFGAGNGGILNGTAKQN